MRILLLLLALLLGGCSTTQKPTTISEEEAHAAIVEVLHLSGSALDSSALGSLPFPALLKEEQLHILDLDEIPLLEQRLQLWRSEVLEAYRSTARGMGEELDPLLDTLVIDDARQLVQSKKMSATSILRAQKGEEIAGSSSARTGFLRLRRTHSNSCSPSSWTVFSPPWRGRRCCCAPRRWSRAAARSWRSFSEPLFRIRPEEPTARLPHAAEDPR